MALTLHEWEKLYARLQVLDAHMLSQSLDHGQRQKLQKEYGFLKNIFGAKSKLDQLQREISELQSKKAATNDAEMSELFELEIIEKKMSEELGKQELDRLLFPPDDLDLRSAFLEIRAGTGGQEAALFAADLVKMYSNYALSQGWRASLVDFSETDLGGIREVTLHIEGPGAHGALKRESGVHRVQRVPQTETSGRVHTSTATVAVFPEAEEVDTVTINASDLRIDTYRAGGAGGQHVNRTDSAVRLTHLPTGLVVACQDERSQHKNKSKAMKMLQSRLLARQRESQEASMSQKRKEMVGTGERAEKVRTYNFPQNRITDHQVDLTLKYLDRIIAGPALQEIIDALHGQEQKNRQKNALLIDTLNN